MSKYQEHHEAHLFVATQQAQKLISLLDARDTLREHEQQIALLTAEQRHGRELRQHLQARLCGAHGPE